MIFGIHICHIYQVMMMCCMQEWLPLLSALLSYLSWMKACALNNSYTIWDILMILVYILYQVKTVSVSGARMFAPPDCPFELSSLNELNRGKLVSSITFIPFEIYWWYLVYIYQATHWVVTWFLFGYTARMFKYTVQTLWSNISRFFYVFSFIPRKLYTIFQPTFSPIKRY